MYKSAIVVPCSPSESWIEHRSPEPTQPNEKVAQPNISFSQICELASQAG